MMTAQTHGDIYEVFSFTHSLQIDDFTIEDIRLRMDEKVMAIVYSNIKKVEILL